MTEKGNQMPDESYLDHIFIYHKPKSGQPVRYEGIREFAKGFGKYLEANCPGCRERRIAIEKLEEVVMWANAAIARNE